MSRRRKKKSRHEEHMSESWLLPYSDLLTLLLALFIVLFAVSSVDSSKFDKISRAFNMAFEGGTGVFQNPSPIPEERLTGIKGEEGTDKEKEKNPADMEKEKLSDIQEKMNAYIAENELDEKLNTSLTDEGLLLTIRDNVLFDSGVAEVRKRDENVAREIASLLVMEPPRNIMISGHTDNVPIRNVEFESNWELSVMRAINFMKLLLENDKLDPSLFSANGFGEYKPVVSNETEAGKARNRRVEILILPQTSLVEATQ